MEVFVRNVPEQGSEQAFKNFMKPHLLQLSIQCFHCVKNKKYASITFLNIEDADRFLEKHGESRQNTTRKPSKSGTKVINLHFLNRRLYFKESNKVPHSHLLGVLAKEDQDRRAYFKNKVTTVSRSAFQDGSEKVLPISFSTTSVSCGVWGYNNDLELVYVPQLIWDVPGVAKFFEGSMILRLTSLRRIDFPYPSTLTILTESGRVPSLIFSMKEPPRFFEIIQDSVAELLAQLGIGLPDQRRQKKKDRHRIPCLGEEHKPIAGNCLVWRIALESTFSATTLSSDVDKRIYSLRRAPHIPHMTYQHTQIRSTSLGYAYVFALLSTRLSSLTCSLPFKVKFQILKLCKNNYLPPATVLRLLPEFSRIVDESPLPVAVATIKSLCSQIDWAGPEAEAESFKVPALIALLRENETHYKKPRILRMGGVTEATSANNAIVHRVKITPAGTYLYGPDSECQNRVLRKYPGNHENILRVQFCEEDGRQIRFDLDVSTARLFSAVKDGDGKFSRFKDVFENGITLADMKFDFLGFSHSSLRAQSCWFVAPFVFDGDVMWNTSIIRNLGDFTAITSPAKCAARIGQTFSDTPTMVSISPKIIRNVGDVERNGRVFSDGVGTMSESVMETIWDKLPKKKSAMAPTCFQIRLSGAKGMLSLDSTLKGDEIVLRPSMIKFEGTNSTDLEICESAWKPLPLYLNRQFIKILEDMGVDDSFFLRNQAKEVERLRSITRSPINASTFLTRQSIGEAMHLPFLIRKLTFLNLDFRNDAFLRDVLEMALLVELRWLKHKTRIPIEKGWHLHGIMDETGILEEGQIFCQVGYGTSAKPIVQDCVIISRAPALHPGDIQLVDAVDVPWSSPLRELHNCIIFSQKGERDLPSSLSGGDLDGDRYYLILDPEARPKTTFPSADYPRLPPVDIGRQVKSNDMADFFLLFMETDQLGRIAINHQLQADVKVNGTNDEVCKLLAGMHSTAVDFSKTGIPVDLSMMPRYPNFRPDFTAPGPHVLIDKSGGASLEDEIYKDPLDDDQEEEGFRRIRYYESKKILGQLYQAIDEKKIFQDIQNHSRAGSVTHTSATVQAVWNYVQRKCKGRNWEDKKEWARDIRDVYDESIQTIMIEYSEHPLRPVTELEAFVGTILGRTGAQTKQQRELSSTLKQKFNEDVAFIVDLIVRDNDESAVRSEDALEKSMACLAISLEDRNRSRKQQQILSFKYLAAGVCLKEVEHTYGSL